MVDERAFLAMIRAQPFAWGPRLVYADWLEEQGETPRAEFVRLLSRLYTRPPAHVSDRQLLLRRMSDLSAYGALSAEPFFLTSSGILMRRVDAGTFWMGGGNGVPGTRRVEIPNDFYLGIFPVTQGEWQSVMGNQPSHFLAAGLGVADTSRFPVESVSWHDVQEFLARLSGLEASVAWAYRLPTDAEWEYACRAAATTVEDCSFDFYFAARTNELSSWSANFNGRKPAGRATRGPYLRRPTRVGTYPPNALGLFDMHGNVWEWTETAVGSTYILRGGAWHSHGRHCRAANHFAYTPEFRSNILGFRLAATRR